MAGGKILLIEDETNLRNNLEMLLSRAGYTVTTAASGSEGLSYARCTCFNVVITDLIMDTFQRFELLECLTACVPCTPIIVITGNSGTHSAEEASRKGAYDYIAKPFAIDALRASIDQALQQRPA